MALTPANQMMNPIPGQGEVFTDWGRLKGKGKSVTSTTIAPPGVGFGWRGIAIFLVAAVGVELIGMVSDITKEAQTVSKEKIERWLRERYGDVLKTRIGDRPKPRRGKKPTGKGDRRITPFVYPQPEIERTLKDVFRPYPKVTKEKETDEPEVDFASWLERRFSQSIVAFQRLRR